MQRQRQSFFQTFLAIVGGVGFGAGLLETYAGVPEDGEFAVAEKVSVSGAADSSLVAMRQSLSLANGESEIFRRRAGELRLRMEAVGAEGGGSDVARLEQRLLKAVNDLQLLRAERSSLQKSLIQLSEAVLRFQKSSTSIDVGVRASLEVEMRSALQVLEINGPKRTSSHPASLADGAIISIKNDLALVIASIGANSGVKAGMPFRVTRGERVIGILQVVDVRERIAGAVVQGGEAAADLLEIGDRLELDSHE